MKMMTHHGSVHLSRVLNSNPNTPNAPEEQIALLEAEGFSFEKKGEKCVYWVLKR